MSGVLGDITAPSVLLIGIGGGGDILATLPLAHFLKRSGVRVSLAGLSWKRREHDFLHRPRRIAEFSGITHFNDRIGLVHPGTKVGDTVHVEAYVSGIDPGRDVLTIDISGGIRETQECLEEYVEKRDISRIVLIDVGGDVLCSGDEPTLRSPICDQTVLAACADNSKVVLAVFGLGADGELTFTDFLNRFRSLRSSSAFIGAVHLNQLGCDDILSDIINGSSECSKAALEFYTKPQNKKILAEYRHIAASDFDLDSQKISVVGVPLRSGAREGELSALTPCYLWFNAKKVYSSSKFSSWLNPQWNVEQTIAELKSLGVRTEADD
ncbi:MAG: DUF1152 domain-containing protein [Deltaproteobacteria bacterium]|nr:DUF1152 domain-containing protein [Deltaproteobacteria bacterium]